MATKTQKKQKGITPTMTIKNQKVNEYVYVLKNGDEITFKDKNFPDKKNNLTLFDFIGD